MKLPEWKPIPQHVMRDDSDTRGFFASLALLAPVVLLALSVLAIVLGLI